MLIKRKGKEQKIKILFASRLSPNILSYLVPTAAPPHFRTA